MSEYKDLLVEIGTEELPPRPLQALALAFAEGMQAGLKKHKLQHGELSHYATPRRLAVIIRALQTAQTAAEVVKRGPALQAAYTDDGKPTPAAQGFARSCGVSVDELETLETDKGKWLAVRQTETGEPTTALLDTIINDALRTLPVPKKMRWGNGDMEFVRPVHWSVVLFGEETVACNILGTQAANQTRGHRFHHPDAITLNSVDDYQARLYEPGKVIASFTERRAQIKQLVEDTAGAAGLQAVVDDDLLDEVTALVEWPVPIAASYEKRFLQLPEEVLIACMQDQQRYFPCRDSDGKLSEKFISIANIASTAQQEIVQGNERVIRPRLSDAAFFWEQDGKRKLADYRKQLDKVIFEQKLGSLLDKSQRLVKLSDYLAKHLGLDKRIAKRAATLAKCDLLSDMVGEFPALQGIMGRYYADLGGEAEAVAIALDEQYQPRFAGAALPGSAHGQLLALAERLDTITGIFAIGKAPTGEKDPYGLRRAAIGSLRILIECHLDLDLLQCIDAASKNYPDAIRAKLVTDDVFEFMLERLRRYYLDNGTDAGIFDAVLAVRPTAPLDFHKRIIAVSEFSRLPEAASLSAANKRIANILKQAKIKTTAVKPKLLQEDAEQQLAQALQQAQQTCAPLLADGDYTTVLTTLAGLGGSVDAFFDDVMVMSDDAKLKQNRLALLKNLADMFMTTADIARLQV
ncbi:MAG: glycine--tRNA ligase subunit beta [Gammaproteobacteria bacterium]